MSQAIMITPCDRGWRWELVDGDGVTTISGLCDKQIAAMDSACRAASVSSESQGRDYPQIVVRHRRPSTRPRR